MSQGQKTPAEDLFADGEKAEKNGQLVPVEGYGTFHELTKYLHGEVHYLQQVVVLKAEETCHLHINSNRNSRSGRSSPITAPASQHTGNDCLCSLFRRIR